MVRHGEGKAERKKDGETYVEKEKEEGGDRKIVRHGEGKTERKRDGET